jgi:hypothetical protein
LLLFFYTGSAVGLSKARLDFLASHPGSHFVARDQLSMCRSLFPLFANSFEEPGRRRFERFRFDPTAYLAQGGPGYNEVLGVAQFKHRDVFATRQITYHASTIIPQLHNRSAPQCLQLERFVGKGGGRHQQSQEPPHHETSFSAA